MNVPVLIFALLLAPAEAEEVRAGVEATLRVQSDHWNRGALEAFCSHYAEDATFISPSGKTSGRAALLERYRTRYPDRAAMGTLRLEVLEVRVAGRDAASVVARWSLRYPDKPEASGLTLIVLHRTGKTWSVVQDASM